ncbi:hypothetical protein CAEBREN_05153 [Caenorhabditis brenneri]|uniref:C-type lectin domain-containing protein n=1 Tax=Caenorhabditis brenneri TaxID=135651 RepID=G0PDF2_CAEBE|nr:hypothetical protein CAEBREN_05153 [Caenorhabditis brenneri]
MRSSILIAFGLVVALSSVEAIFRPGYGGGYRPPSSYHGGHSEDCTTKKPVETTSTAAPTTPTTTTTVAPTTRAPQCPTGFTGFTRQPAADNDFTGLWCMKGVYQKDPIKVNDANALCKANGGELTMIGGMAEQAHFGNELRAKILEFGWPSGAVAVDGKRIPACVSKDSAVLDSEACGPTKAFVLTQKNTSPAFAWTIWADKEPSANNWTYDIEECIQFTWDPSGKEARNLKLNDIYCNMEKAPNDPENVAFWNFGAICGTLPV